MWVYVNWNHSKHIIPQILPDIFPLDKQHVIVNDVDM